MQATIRDAAGDVLAELTTEHSASSYGQTVLVYKGEALGPDDLIEQPGDAGPIRAGSWVAAWGADPERTEAEVGAAVSFWCGPLTHRGRAAGRWPVPDLIRNAIKFELIRLGCDARAVGPTDAIAVLDAGPDRVRLADVLQSVELPEVDALALLAELPDTAGPGAVWLALGSR